MTAPQTQQQTVDGTDPQGQSAAATALEVVLAAEFLGWLAPGWPSFFGNRTGNRRDILEQKIGMSLRMYITRVASDFAQAASQAGISIDSDPYTAASDTTAEMYPHVLDIATRWADQTYRTLERRARNDGLTDRSYGHDLSDENTARDIARSAAGQAARAVASYATNGTRDTMADKMGALWSEWVTRHDDRVRETHAEMDDMAVPFGGGFVSPSGAILRYPGDPQAPPSETMGCRCHLRYRFRPKETSLAV